MERTNFEREDAPSFVDVLCNVTGEFAYPNWKQCSENVYCGDPPSIDHVNGTRKWIDGSSEGEDVYDTSIQYICVNGSQFDLGGADVGEKPKRTLRCRWKQKWHPFLQYVFPGMRGCSLILLCLMKVVQV